MWTPPRRHRLMKLRIGDTVIVKREVQDFTGEVSRIEADGFWIASPDGLSYRFAVMPSEPTEKGRTPIAE